MMVIDMLYDDVVFVLFCMVLILILLVSILIVLDYKKRRTVDKMVSPRYIISGSSRRRSLPMSEGELLEVKKELLKKEKELKKMILDERRDLDRQKRISANLLKETKIEVAKQKKLAKNIRLGLVSVAKQKIEIDNKMKNEIIKLRQQRAYQQEQASRDVSKHWHQQIEAHPRDGREWLADLKKRKRFL